jgi:hypothetical protein
VRAVLRRGIVKSFVPGNFGFIASEVDGEVFFHANACSTIEEGGTLRCLGAPWENPILPGTPVVYVPKGRGRVRAKKWAITER